jgi:hypothetical protein
MFIQHMAKIENEQAKYVYDCADVVGNHHRSLIY